MVLPSERYLASFRADSAALAEAARDHLDAAVPWCGEWNMKDLVEHTGLVHQRTAETVRRRSSARVSNRDLAPPPADGTVAWFEKTAEDLAQVLEEAGTDAPVWNWTGRDQTSGFWYRRMAQETLVHRWDAETAAGVTSPVLETDMAVDGIDEFVDDFLPLLFARGPVEGLRGSIHLHATDGDGEWWAGFSVDGVEVRHQHDKGDCAVRGPAGQLLLLAWNRRRADGLEVFGDTAVLDRWREYVRI